MLVPVLLSALATPNKHSKEALEILLTTTFVNTIDAASLALIVPVVYRGLRDRAGDVRRRASMIVGNMSALVNEPKVWFGGCGFWWVGRCGWVGVGCIGCCSRILVGIGGGCMFCTPLHTYSTHLPHTSTHLPHTVHTTPPHQDLAPYVPLLLPEIKTALIDPLPEVRAVAAKALGSLFKGMGSGSLQEVLPWMMDLLSSEVGGCFCGWVWVCLLFCFFVGEWVGGCFLCVGAGECGWVCFCVGRKEC